MAKKKNRNEQKRHLLERDNSLCGIHLEGCGKPINSIHSCNVDHIIPQKIFKQLAKGDNGTFLDEREYNRWWNKQPMHTQCNTKRGTGYNRGWPNFTCKCHFLYFHNGHAFIYAVEDDNRQTWSWKAHAFVPDVVTPQAAHDMHMGLILPEIRHDKTHTHIEYNQTNRRGHAFRFLHPNWVAVQNTLNLFATGLLHKGAIWAGWHLDDLHPLHTTGGPRIEENYLILPDLFGLGFQLSVPITVVVPRGALLNWHEPPGGKHVLKRITPTARNKMPLEPTKIWWAGGQPVATTDAGMIANADGWFKAMDIPYNARQSPASHPISYFPTGNKEALNQRDPSVPDASFGRLIPPKLSLHERAAFLLEREGQE